MIKEFQKEHKYIFDALTLMQQMGMRSKQSRSKLLSVQELIVEHLNREDETLYPLLLSSADARTRTMAHEYIEDMKETSRIILGFFEKYSHNTLATNQDLDADFVIDIAYAIKRLRLRIAREEKFLYPLAQQELDKKQKS